MDVAAVLGIQVDATGAVSSLKGFERATNEASSAASRQEQVLRQLAVANRATQLANADNRASLGGLSKAQRDQSRAVIESVGGMEQYVRIMKELKAAEVSAAQGANQLSAAVKESGSHASTVASGFRSLVGVLGTLGIGVSITAGIRKFVDEAAEAQKVQAQLGAVLKSTGGAAGKSASDLNAAADSLSRLSTFSDEAVGGAQALLLTFTSIRGETFDSATQAVIDLSTALGQDLKSSAIQVGKALNDPVQGVNALQRVGVSFTKSQEDMIKSLVETGHAADAQRLILKELETEFGGSAEAARNTLGGALSFLQNQFGNLFEATDEGSKGIVDAINDIANALPNLKKQFDDAFGNAVDWTKDIALHLNIANQGLTNLSLLLKGDFAGYREGVKVIQGLRQEDEALERHHRLRGKTLGFLGAIEQENARGHKAAALAATVDDEKELKRLREKLALLSAIKIDFSGSQTNIDNIGQHPNIGTFGGIPVSGTFDKDNIPLPGVGMSLSDLDEIFEAYHRKVKEERDQRLKDEQDAKKAAEKYALDMKAIWRSGLNRIITDGTKSFRDFFDDVGRLFSALMQRMEQEGKTDNKRYRNLGLASSAISGGFLGYQIGQQEGSRAGGAFLGAAGGAAQGAQIAGLPGAIAGGIAGFVGGLLGGAKAAREHAEALKAAQKVFTDNLASYRAAATGTQGSLPEQIRQAQRAADALRTDAAAAFKQGGGWFSQGRPNTGLNQALADITADEATYVARLKEEDAIKRKQFADDLQVRLLRATGHESEANTLALQLQQQREYDEAVKAGADAATLALLVQVQAAEKVKETINGLTTAVRNAPSGFKINQYINEFAEGRDGYGSSFPTSIPYAPKFDPTKTAPVVITNATFTIQGKDGKALLVDLTKELRKVADSTLGINAASYMALDLVN